MTSQQIRAIQPDMIAYNSYAFFTLLQELVAQQAEQTELLGYIYQKIANLAYDYSHPKGPHAPGGVPTLP